MELSDRPLRRARALPALLPALALSAALAVAPDALAAQEEIPPVRWGVVAGVGNAMGWVGIQAERHVSAGVSVFGGLGYSPSIEGGPASGVSGAVGVRGFRGGDRHRAFVDVSVSQLAVSGGGPAFVGDSEGGRHFGPGVSVGYHFVARGGFTLQASVGAGWALGVPDDVDGGPVVPLFSLGVGYSVRGR